MINSNWERGLPALVSIYNVSCTFGPSSLTHLSMGAVVNHERNTDKEGALRSQVSTMESHHIFNFFLCSGGDRGGYKNYGGK